MRTRPILLPTGRVLAISACSLALGLGGSRLSAPVMVWMALTLACFIMATLGWVIHQFVSDLGARASRSTQPMQLQVGVEACTWITWPANRTLPHLGNLRD